MMEVAFVIFWSRAVEDAGYKPKLCGFNVCLAYDHVDNLGVY